MAGAAKSVAPSRAVVLLSVLVAVLALVAAGTGLLWHGEGDSRPAVSPRGEAVELYDRGLYRHDSVFKAAGNRGADAVLLLLGVPLLAVALILYRRGSLPGALLLAGALAWTLYLYASLALGTAFNELFPVYVVLFGSSFYALVPVLTALSRAAAAGRLGGALPRRSVAVLLLTAGLVTTVVWTAPLAGPLVGDRPPVLLEGRTTMVTEALDLALIVPATFLAALLLLRRDPRGHIVAFPLLVLLVVLLPVIATQTAFQLAAGVEFAPAEIAGPIGGFLVLGVSAALLVARILRGVGA